ncbi:hypothetical protein B0J17DRAFT_408221 [Rhizoctonia solani]|nr:hypothetical protein B0J17DRAFT_408221 [Rhizoctonia solani]
MENHQYEQKFAAHDSTLVVYRYIGFGSANRAKRTGSNVKRAGPHRMAVWRISGTHCASFMGYKLVAHAAQGEYAYTLKPNSLNDFIICMREVLFRISSGLPEHWNILSIRDGGRKCHSGLVALRLLWSIMFVVVNLHPGHGSLPFILSVLNQAIARIFAYHGSFIEGFETVGLSISRLPRAITPQTCLPALLRIYPHEDIVMLQGRRANVRPEARLMTGRIVNFDTLTDLRNALGSNFQSYSKNQVVEPIPMKELHKADPELPKVTVDSAGASLRESAGSRLEEPEPEPTQDIPMALPPRPDTPTSVAESENESLDDGGNKPSLTPEEAALRISRAWRRSVKREEQRQRISDFDHGGQLYEQYRQHFPRVGIKTPERDKLGLKLIRGPCISIVLGLQLLVEEVDAYVEALDEDIHAPGLTPSQLATTQESIKERKKKAE